MSKRALVVDDQPAFRRLLQRVLEDAGWDVTVAGDGREALERARESTFDVVFSDVKMPKMDGHTLLDRLRSEQPDTPVILLTAHGSVPDAVGAMRRGAFDYLIKPLDDPDDVSALAAKALAQRRRSTADTGPIAKVTSSAVEFVFEHPAMIRVDESVRRVARTDATVLLTGESGTGKEVVAKRLHELSRRSDKPFVAVNCAALADSLLESELFGHERGAFTGADKQRKGRFEVADGGTLFLDEIGETSPALQAKLLRVLQERTFDRVGGSAPISVDVRLVAATNRDLLAEASEGRFRQDLYYRLNVVPVHLPPLRERGSDALLLARHFLTELALKHGRHALELSPEAEKLITGYPWPGNVRELNNAIERATILCLGNSVQPGDLGVGPAAPGGGGLGSDAPLNLKELERVAIQRALETCGGNRREAADLLGIGLRTLHYKLNQYGLR